MLKDYGGFSPAKITRPVARNIVIRERLFSLIDKESDKPITWVSAPAGSGKTTFISSYIQQRRLRCLWYQIDAGDADIATFFHYIGLAVRKANPNRRNPMPLIAPEHFGNIAVFSRRYFEEIYSRLIPCRRSTFKKTSKWLIVFDNYQDVHGAQFHEMLVNGLDAIPSGIRVIIISRAEPPLQFSRDNAGRMMGFIGWNDIRFTMQEAEQMVEVMGRKSCLKDTSAMTYLYEKTDGWAAGITLLLNSSRHRENPKGASDCFIDSSTIPSLERSALFDYFAAEIFNKTDARTRDFLLKTSFLPSMTLPMAERLTKMRDAGAILSELSRRNYFTERLSDAPPVYRYHPLFKEFLTVAARNILNRGDLYKVQSGAALLLEDTGQVEDAICLFAEARDWQNLFRIVESNAGRFLLEGRNRTLLQWIGMFPLNIADSNPEMLYLKGICLMPFDFHKSMGLLEDAFCLYEKARDITGSFKSCISLINAIVTYNADFAMLDRLIDWVNTHDGHICSLSSEVAAEAVSNILLALTFRRPDHPRINIWRKRAESLVAEGKVTTSLAILGVSLALHYTFFGFMTRASVVLEGLRPYIKSPNVSPFAQIQWQVAETMYALCGDHSGRSYIDAVEKGLIMSKEFGTDILNIFFAHYGAIGGLITADKEAVDRYLQIAKDARSKAAPAASAIYVYIDSWMDLISGNPAKAVEQIKHGLSMLKRLGHPFNIMFSHIGMAIALFEIGKHKEAFHHLTEARNTCRTDSALIEQMIQIAEAYFSFKMGKEKNGLDLISKAMSNGSRHGIMAFPYQMPHIMGLICAKSLEAGIETEYAKILIKKLNLEPPDAMPDIMTLQEWPYPVKIYTLGRFEITIHDKPLLFSGKVPQKPLLLLKAIISFGGKDVSEDRLTDTLWPDSYGDLAHKSFESTLARLRNISGSKDYLKYRAGLVSLDTKNIWVDSLALEGILNELDQIFDKNTFLKMSHKALELYKGKFLPADSSHDWAIARSEILKNRLVRIILKAGGFCESLGRWEDAIEYYQKGLEVDEYSERIYQRLMLCYGRLGRKAEAVRLFERCSRILSIHFGVGPSQETREIYLKIKDK